MDATSPVQTSSAPKLSRRTYVIDRGFQLKYTLMLVVLGAAVSAVFGAMMYLAHVDAQHMVRVPIAVQEELNRANESLLWLLVAMTVLMAMAFGLLGILVTHRVAGPVFVMSHYVSILARGRYPLLRKLRKQDELQQFFDRFQSAIEVMRRREADEARTLHQALDTLSAVATTAETKQAIEQLRAVGDRKKDATDHLEGLPGLSA